MMFLRKAQKMNKGLSKLRQYLILALRMLAVAAMILVIARPLAGGLLGLTGGAPDSVIILLDRSASMEEQLLTTGTSKRAAGLLNLTAAIKDAYGKRSKLVLIDSATLKPVLLENADALTDLPQTGPTDTAADIPALLQGALDYLTTNETGRTDIWLVSDLRRSDWDSSGGRWPALRAAFSTLQGVRFQILAYPETSANDLGVIVEGVSRRESSSGAELLFDLRLQRAHPTNEATTVPLRVVINGISSTLEVPMKGTQTLLQAQSVPVDKGTKRGWGRIEVPSDGVPANDVYHFVFDDPAPLKSAIITDDPDIAKPLQAALSAPADPSRRYETTILPGARTAEIDWEETGLIVWQTTLPDPESTVAKQLAAHLERGRRLIFVPPKNPSIHAISGLRWTAWEDFNKSVLVDWWRSDAGLLGATRAGTALPVGELEIQRWCHLEGESIPLARLGEDVGRAPILVQSLGDRSHAGSYFLTTLPSAGTSSLARDGVVLYAMLHRALSDGASSLGNAQQRIAGANALADDLSAWRRIYPEMDEDLSINRPFRAGVLEHQTNPIRVALNRSPSEDVSLTLNETSLEELFSGLDWRLLERTLQNEKSLTSEVWRTFLLLMAAAILFEAMLCMPRRRATVSVPAIS